MGRLALCVTAVMIAIGPPSALASDDAANQTEPSEATIVPMPTTERTVCRREQVMGSHMTKRVCRTSSQVKAERDEARQLIDAMERVPTQIRGPNE